MGKDVCIFYILFQSAIDMFLKKKVILFDDVLIVLRNHMQLFKGKDECIFYILFQSATQKKQVFKKKHKNASYVSKMFFKNI